MRLDQVQIQAATSGFASAMADDHDIIAGVGAMADDKLVVASASPGRFTRTAYNILLLEFPEQLIHLFTSINLGISIMCNGG